MKRGPRVVTLQINPDHPPVFDIQIQPGKLVSIYAHMEKGKIVSAKQTARLVPVLVFDVDKDAAEIDRRIILLPAEDGWVGDPTAFCAGTFVNPVDGTLIAVYEATCPPPADDEVTVAGPDVLAALAAKEATELTADETQQLLEAVAEEGGS